MTLYIPTISTAPDIAPVAPVPPTPELGDEAHELWELFRLDLHQRRHLPQLHPVLIEFAQWRADYIVRTRLDRHTDEFGIGPNWNLQRRWLYRLPSWYKQDDDANNIESLVFGASSPLDAWAQWMDSPPHRRHLLGDAPMYQAQTCVGIGATQFGDVFCFVIVTAPPE